MGASTRDPLGAWAVAGWLDVRARPSLDHYLIEHGMLALPHRAHLIHLELLGAPLVTAAMEMVVVVVVVVVVI